ncbi:MAG TPA: class I SAM-dependent methyltransferase [Streptosporangiaceae bacterium]|nr:class I SAM-dependent methyltransferase [Streptosporangiaceae bacterium]
MRTQRAMSFGAVADEYNRLRPSPPAAAVDWLLPSNARLVVDLAAGTGLLSRALHVDRVIAIEPDPRMGTVLRANSPGIRVVAGVGEALPLAGASVDAVLISSAWHWMDPQRAVPEIGRVLRDGGRFGLIWNSRDREVDWIREIDVLREPTGTAADAAGPGPRQRNRDVVLPTSHAFTDIETASFTFTMKVAIDDFAPMIGTYSRIITASEHERAKIFSRVRALVEARFPGAAEIELPMRSLCWRATRTTR